MRRPVLIAAALCGLALLSACPPPPEVEPPFECAGEHAIDVAAGDVDSGAVVLWALAPDAGEVTFSLAVSDDFAELAQSVTAPVRAGAGSAKVRVEDLGPGTSYFYCAKTSDGGAGVGRFKTPAESGHPGLRFGVSGDWRGELAPYPAVRNAAARALDFFVALGDTIYADYPSPEVPAEQARTLDEFWRKHREVYSPRHGLNTLADLRAACAWFAMIDDHEVGNDFAGGAPASSDARFGGSGLINESPLFVDGLRAFLDYNPIAELRYPDDGEARSAGRSKLYRMRRFGDDAALLILDARSFRDTELDAIGDPTDAAQVDAFVRAAFDDSRSMLGRRQLDELKADLRALKDQVTWKFVLVPEPIQNLGPILAQDRFEGYAAERSELLQFIHDEAIANVVFVAADIHGTLVNNIQYRQTADAQARGASATHIDVPTAFEITTGAVAYDAPFGPTVVDVARQGGFLNALQYSYYLRLGSDAERDDFIRQLLDTAMNPFGYDLVGLPAQLGTYAGLSAPQVTLLQGDWVRVHGYTWSEFAIDADSQALTVTTYGVARYSEAELNADPGGVSGRQPEVIQQFSVTPAL